MYQNFPSTGQFSLGQFSPVLNFISSLKEVFIREFSALGIDQVKIQVKIVWESCLRVSCPGENCWKVGGGWSCPVTLSDCMKDLYSELISVHPFLSPDS